MRTEDHLLSICENHTHGTRATGTGRASAPVAGADPSRQVVHGLQGSRRNVRLDFRRLQGDRIPRSRGSRGACLPARRGVWWRACWDLLSTKRPNWPERVPGSRRGLQRASHHPSVGDPRNADSPAGPRVCRSVRPVGRIRIWESDARCGHGGGTTTAGLRARSTATHDPLLQLPYADALAMDFSGPGRVEKGEDSSAAASGSGRRRRDDRCVGSQQADAKVRDSVSDSLGSTELEVFLFTSRRLPVSYE